MSKEGRNEQVDEKVLNIKRFCMELSEIVDQKITYEHVHPVTDGRYYYTQGPEEGFPLLLHHYRGVYCVDIHPNDYKKLETGEITPQEYIGSAKFLVGYYWGGGSAVTGGYYQPLDIVNKKAEVQRYLKILRCRGNYRSSGHTPNFDECVNCNVENCPFSKFKEGSWDNEMQEYDPRKDFYKALVSKMSYQSYKISGLYTEKLVRGESDNCIYLLPSVGAFNDEITRLETYIPENVMRGLMKHEIMPESWEEYIEQFEILVFDHYLREYVPATAENINNSIQFVKRMYASNRRERAGENAHTDNSKVKKTKVTENTGLLAKVKTFFGGLF